MQIPEDPTNSDIRAAILQLREELRQQVNDDIRAAILQLREELGQQVRELDDKIEKLDYKFDTYQKGTDGMVRMATTIIIATASVVVLSSLSPALMAIVTALSAANAS